jgi:hypothetical protein
MTWRHMESRETAQHIILMHVPFIFIYNQLMHKYISHIFSLNNIHSYMFSHLCVILREFQKFYLAKLHKFLKLKKLKL